MCFVRLDYCFFIVNMTHNIDHDYYGNVDTQKAMEQEVGQSPSSSWQVVSSPKSTNKKRGNATLGGEFDNKKSKPDCVQQVEFISPNRFNILNNEVNDNSTTIPNNSNEESLYKTPKTPPIFVPNISNIKAMVQTIESVVSSADYSYRLVNHNTVKVFSQSPDVYRKIVHKFNELKIAFHTYQLKQERAYRVVLKNMHFSTDPLDIKNSLEQLGYQIRSIVNARHYQTKQPLSMFYIDLEPKLNNKDIFNVQYLLHAKVTFEPPLLRREVVQCKRCQVYGHTRTYCKHPFKCVRCGRGHDSSTCTKDKTSPATCALCGEGHPANYKGCSVYKSIKNREFPSLRSKITEPLPQAEAKNQQRVVDDKVPTESNNYSNYADAVKNSGTCDVTNLSETLSQFFDRFEKLFMQQSQQIGSLLNLLTTLVSKLK